MKREVHFEVMTPLGIRVRTTKEYWEYIECSTPGDEG